MYKNRCMVIDGVKGTIGPYDSLSEQYTFTPEGFESPAYVGPGQKDTRKRLSKEDLEKILRTISPQPYELASEGDVMLRSMRKKRDLTLEALAEKAGVSRETARRFEIDPLEPSLRIGVALIRALTDTEQEAKELFARIINMKGILALPSEDEPVQKRVDHAAIVGRLLCSGGEIPRAWILANSWDDEMRADLEAWDRATTLQDRLDIEDRMAAR